MSLISAIQCRYEFMEALKADVSIDSKMRVRMLPSLLICTFEREEGIALFSGSKALKAIFVVFLDLKVRCITARATILTFFTLSAKWLCEGLLPQFLEAARI
jgi:hypothetical protein